MTTTPLTGLDLQIATALQVDPRAPWRRIAHILDAGHRAALAGLLAYVGR